MFTNLLTQAQVVNNSFLKRYIKTFNWDQILSNLSKKIVMIIFITILFWVFKRVGLFFINRLFRKHQQKTSEEFSLRRISTLHTLSINTLNYGLVIFWIYSVLSMIGIPIGTLVTGAGIFSLAIGLGAQGFVSDIISGFFILFEHQLNVGDYVKIGDIEGTVRAIGLRTTQINSVDGTLNYIPNRNITVISNFSRNNMIAIIQIKINPDTPIKKSLNVIEKVNQLHAANNSDIIGKPDVRGTVTLPDGSVAIQIYITTKNGAQWAIQRQYLGYYLEALTKNGIKLPKSPLVMPNTSNN